MGYLISYFVIIGIIKFANGKSSFSEDSYLVKDANEIRKLLDLLAKEGKYDVSLSQNNNDKASQNYYRDGNSNSAKYYMSNENLDEEPMLNYIGNLNELKSNDVQKFRGDNNILDKLMGLERDKVRHDQADESEYDNANEIVGFLNDLQKKLLNDGNYESQLRLKNRNYRNDGDKHNDRTYNDRFDRDGLRCRGNNCGRDRGELDDRDEDRNDGDGLRCSGKNCARGNDVRLNTYDDDRNDRDDRDNPRDRDDDNDRDRDDTDSLRCRGNKCAQSRYNDDDYSLRSSSNPLTKKIKVSDDIDAVVLDISDVDRLLSKLSIPKQRTNKPKNAKFLDNIDLESLIDMRSGNDKKSNVEAVVFDLTQIEDGDNVAKQIKRLLSQTNEPSDKDYEDYGNLVEENLKRGSFNFDKSSYQKKGSSKILPHNEDNNNVYVPQWLLKEVISRTTLRDPNSDQLVRSLFPLTRQQKERLVKILENRKQNSTPRKIFRRNFEQDVGVPFHLEVQGLGQVSP